MSHHRGVLNATRNSETFLVASSKLLLLDLLGGEFHCLLLLSLRLLDVLSLLLQDHLNVAGNAHESVDATMGSVCAASSLLCRVALDMLDHEEFRIQVLELSVRLGILEELQENASTLLGPATLSVLEGLSLSSPSDTRIEPMERNTLLLSDDISEVSLGVSELSTLQSTASLIGVLEVNAQINSHSLARLGGVLSIT